MKKPSGSARGGRARELPLLLGMSVERKLAPTLVFLLAHFPTRRRRFCSARDVFLRGHVAPRVSARRVRRDSPLRPVRSSRGTSGPSERRASAAEARRQGALVQTRRARRDFSRSERRHLGGFFTKEKISVRSRRRVATRPKPNRTGTDASARSARDPRARRRRGGARPGSTPRSARARVAPRSAEPMPRRMSSYDTRIVLLMVRFMHTRLSNCIVPPPRRCYFSARLGGPAERLELPDQPRVRAARFQELLVRPALAY